MYRIDLWASAGMLDEAELASVRAAFRQLQCAADLKPAMKNLLSVMLIFLDAKKGYSRRD
jgi:hypothetical protein